jgi:flavin-dependent dehydrogenase
MATSTIPPRVVVIGCGPAGATVSTLLAQQGIPVRVYERERFPRFHIGESLIPETYWVLERLKVLDKLRKTHFTKKYSVQFVNQHGKVSEPFYFVDHKPHESSQTWQVLRSEFDLMLMQNAREQGVDVREGVRVLDVMFDGQRARGVRVQGENGAAEEVPADVVVDASGQGTMIISRLQLREWDPALRKAAVWTYFQGGYRDTGKNEGATIVAQLKDKAGWFWYIPLHDDVVSVGVVADVDYLFHNRADRDPEKTYWEEVDRCPGIKTRLQSARRVDEFRVAKEYSYHSKAASGDGWVVVGDAFGFLDPLYSSGVLLALKSGALAANAIAEGLAKGDTSAAQLGKWSPDFVEGMTRMRRMVLEYYEGLSFGRFIRRHPHFKGYVTDMLIGDLFKDELDQVFEPMAQVRNEAAASG